MKLTYRTLILFCVGACLLIPSAQADDILVGILSYDTFIPAAPGSPGVDAFDIANLTGDYNLAPDFPVTDSLTFQSAVLTLTFSDSTQQVFDLGDIGPGYALDGDGNPLVQVPDTDVFDSAEFTATLAPTTFMLYDGTEETANSASLDILLTPSSGSTLTVDVDQTTIDVLASSTAIPEPASLLLSLAGLVLIMSNKR